MQDETDFLFDLEGRVRNLGFAPSPKNALFPVFEAIANGSHAIYGRFDANAPDQGKIKVEILRAESEVDDPPVIGFRVSDNGEGLNEANWKAFRTADTPAKLKKGGKGVGRLSWLKVFEATEVSSVYQFGASTVRRSFSFSILNGSQPIGEYENTECVPELDYGTRVLLKPFAEGYTQHCPRSFDTIAAQIVGHFLKEFASGDFPSIELIDETVGREVNLKEFFHDNKTLEHAETHQVPLSDADDAEQVEIEIFHLLLKNRIKLHERGKHRVLYVGNGRVVQDNVIDGQIGLGLIGPDRDSVYVAIVSGPYLNSHVNQERTRFTFSDDVFETIRKSVLVKIKDYLDPYISEIRERQAKVALKVVRENPQFLAVTNDLPLFVSENLKLSVQNEEDVYLELARHRRRRKRDIRRKVGNLTDAPHADLMQRVAEIADAINIDKKAALAEYVVQRKEILDLLESDISYQDPEKRDYLKEEMVHDLIIPIRSDYDQLDYDEHNLWLLDDRLAFYSFLKSDRPFNTYLDDSDSGKEPDIAVVFDRSLAFDRDGGDEPIVIVEFKRPGRKGYSDSENPVTQVLKYVAEFRKGGSFADRSGKHRKPIPESTRFICFVVADFTPKLEEMLQFSIAQHKSADGEGYFGFSPAHNAFVEVLPYNKMLHDARLRNQRFFEALGLTE
uniref:hypothetical protein n=1 Tax=uncultured Altererythrobacter sp. TaxID=500840 RepID=UPI002635C39B|nr:hypothetical protein [uncultured Altererythrobacter sp.]